MLAVTLGEARMRPLPAAVYTALTVGALAGFGSLLGVHWPEGLLRLPR
jgi:hypothetical protein